MGWRSWNLYGANVNQKLIEGIMDGMVKRDRMVDGKPTSLCDLGYCDVGLDDNWQACGSYGPDKLKYHDEDGNPVVNEDRFPDFKSMTDHAHSLGLTSGWCISTRPTHHHTPRASPQAPPHDPRITTSSTTSTAFAGTATTASARTARSATASSTRAT